MALKRLHQALCEFTFGKDLKRPPVLLSGGLKAWTDIFGTASLRDERQATSGNPAQKSYRTSIGLGIRSIPQTSLSSLRIEDHRPQESPRLVEDESSSANPIDLEEEKAWIEKLQRDQKPLKISVPTNYQNMDVKRQRRSTSIVSAGEPYYPRTIEQFVSPIDGVTAFLMLTSLVSTIPRIPCCPATVDDDPNTGNSSFHGISYTDNACLFLKPEYDY